MNRFAKARFRLAITAMIFLAAAFCHADDASRRSRPMENRFLIVIDTSSAMKSRTNGIEQAVAGLLQSDMHEEFRKGDTLGVWTYDDQLHEDFPMQVWSKETKDAVSADVLRYVRHQRYEKRARLGKVLTAVGQVMEKSDRLTVILIHDGSELIRGTQFDGDINDLQKHYARQFRSAHLPMVTILTARLGQVFDYTINYPGSITIPHTANALPPPETNAPPAAIVAVAPPPTNTVPTEPTPPPRRIEIIMSGTNSITRTITPSESAANNPPSATNNIVMVATPRPQPPPPATVAPAPVVVAPIVSNPPPTAPKPQPTEPEPVAVTVQPEPMPSVASSAPPKNPPTTPAPASIPTAAPASAPSTEPARSPAPVSPPEVVRSPAPVRSPGPVITPAPVPLPSPAPTPFAVASAGQQVALFVIAFSLLTIAVVLVVFLVRRSRGDAPPSLISQSIDRGR